MNTPSLSFARASLLAGVFALTACPAGEPVTTDTDATAGSEATTDTTSAGPTSTTETTASTSTDGGATEPATDSDTDATTEEPDTTTGGVVPPELDAACESLCEKFIACDWEPQYRDVASCKLDCASNTPGGMCVAPAVALYQCVGGLTCEELEAEEWPTCAAEEDALPEACGEPDCQNLGASAGPDSCSYGYACPNAPAEEIVCEGDTCTCLVDGEAMGTCGASEGFCDLEPYEKADIAFECCGFEF
ncbi:hypothetical protein [Nannocystis pusilla]|uniref:hypothetical protein n=1 Tax=Nannocystis pusilla TaxID=889268 RepID=UPI003BF1DA76